MHSGKNAVAAYYDTHQFYYTYFWSRTALHYGLWYPETRHLREAVRNTDDLIIDTLRVSQADIVLDAGCGVGGTAIHVARSTGARVEGITLSPVQLRIAQREALGLHTPLVNFSLQDFNETHFSDNTFSKVYGIESVCYAESKGTFLREAFRLLKHGGKLAIVDTFLVRDFADDRERRIYSCFLEGWVVPNLASRENFSDQLIAAGFVDTRFVDLQRYIWPSINRLFRASLLSAPLNTLKFSIGIAPRNLSAVYQKPFFERGIGLYGMFVATKP